MDTSFLIELFGACAGIIYVVLEILKKRVMWVVGIVTSVAYIYIFTRNGFYAMAGLNVYYVAISFYGLWRWKVAPDICRAGIRITSFCLLAIMLLFILLSIILARFTDSPIPYSDALITSLGIVASWMLSRSYLEQWWIWIAANILAAGVAAWQGLYPSAVLFIAYTVAAVIGYRRWKRKISLPLPHEKDYSR